MGVSPLKTRCDKVMGIGTDHPINSVFQIITLTLMLFFALKKTCSLGARPAGGIAFEAVTFKNMAEGLGKYRESEDHTPRHAARHDGDGWPQQSYDCG